MGAARFTHANWRVSLKVAAIFSSSASYSIWSRGSPVRLDSFRPVNPKHAENNAERTTESVAPKESENLNADQAKEDKGTASSTEEQSSSAWDGFTQTVGAATDSYSSADWTGLIKNLLAPTWTSLLPGSIQTLQRELSLAPGSTADQIWEEAQNPSLNPEITRNARVRIGEGLCRDERYYRWRRRRAMVKSLAAYLNLKERDIHPDDVPVIALCSSGGGLRAMVSGAGSYLAAKESGLWDCAMYTAGVSGTCWLQTVYNSSLGGQNFHRIIDHLKQRLDVHFAFPPRALGALTTAPTNKYLLRGLVEKLKGDPDADFGLVDIYGLLLSARLLVPPGQTDVLDRDLKLSNQRIYIDNGSQPLPIYTAVRHEIPTEVADPEPASDELKKTAERESWFQWFEFTPYEFFCEELSAGIPAWAVGRHFRNGRDTTPRGGYSVPELRITGLMGLWGSAFCATLAHYYKEIRPTLRGLAGFGGIDSLIEGKNENLSRVHPIDPAMMPNYVLGLKDKLPSSCPRSIFENSHLRLMDSGMSNNLPIYPLLRADRDVDLIVAFDASADLKEDNWLSAVDGYALQRGIRGWPIGSGWPKAGTTPQETAHVLRESSENRAPDIDRAETREGDEDEKAKRIIHGALTESDPSLDLSYCNIWLGSAEERTVEREPPPTKRLFHPPGADHCDSDFQLTRPDAGIAVAYFPLIPNESAPPLAGTSQATGNNDTNAEDSSAERPLPVDPTKDDFMSTWNFVYTPEQVDALASLARANFAEGEDQVKRVVRGIYERKKRVRLERKEQRAGEDNPFF